MCSFLFSLFLLSVSGSKAQAPERTMVELIYNANFVDWKTAQTYCRKHHTDLISIRDKKDKQRFIDAGGWIGLFRENAIGQWKWSHGDETASYYIWDQNEPKQNYSCTFKRRSSDKWESDFCETTHTFTCFEEKLVLVKENKTWEEALDHCRSLRRVNTNNPPNRDHLYDLASLITEDEHITAREKAQEATTDEVWTGLRFLAGRWWWADQEAMLYGDIESCPTDRSCGVMEKKGTADFATRDCRERRNFFCYKRV